MKAPFASVLRSASMLFAFTAAMLSLALPAPVAASEQLPLVISTSKPLGPVPGIFSTAGAFADNGEVFTEQRIVSALPSPFGVVTHFVLRFEGQDGTFRIRAQIIETATEDPSVFANHGVWAVVGGTGDYASLRGTGTIEGTVNDAANLITRIYTGLVHFDPPSP